MGQQGLSYHTGASEDAEVLSGCTGSNPEGQPSPALRHSFIQTKNWVTQHYRELSCLLIKSTLSKVSIKGIHHAALPTAFSE